jgi:hypothetical protein
MQTLVILVYGAAFFFIAWNIAVIWISCSNKWCKTTGMIISRQLKINTYPTKQPASEGPIVRNTYLIRIKYSYSVNGKKYLSARMNLNLIDREYSEETVANVVLDSLVRNGSVTVFYNRYLPFISVLQPAEIAISLNIVMAIIGVIIIVGVYSVTRGIL